jgi:hypothetical protein
MRGIKVKRISAAVRQSFTGEWHARIIDGESRNPFRNTVRHSKRVFKRGIRFHAPVPQEGAR